MQQHQPVQAPPQAVQAPPQAVQWQVAAPPVGLPPDTRTSPKQREGAPLRLWTGVIHLCLGFVLIICGVVVLSVRFPEPDYDTYDNRKKVEGIDRRDGQVWPIWIGAALMFNAVLGMISKRSRVVISLYMAFSILSSVVTAMAIIPISVSLAISNQIRMDLAEGEIDEFDDYGNPCSSSSFRSSSFRSSVGSVVDVHAQQRICVEETLSAAKLHFVFHCVILLFLLVEFVASIISAISTCVGLDCCSSTQGAQQVLYYQTQVPQFQVPVVMGNPNEPPPPYTTHFTPAPNQPPSTPAAGGVHSSGQPQQLVVPSPSQQTPGQETYLTPDARGTVATSQTPQDDGLYVAPDARPDRPPLAAPHSPNEYSYADPQYRPGPPTYSNDRSHRGDTQPDADQNYITITN